MAHGPFPGGSKPLGARARRREKQLAAEQRLLTTLSRYRENGSEVELKICGANLQVKITPPMEVKAAGAAA